MTYPLNFERPNTQYAGTARYGNAKSEMIQAIVPCDVRVAINAANAVMTPKEWATTTNTEIFTTQVFALCRALISRPAGPALRGFCREASNAAGGPPDLAMRPRPA